MKFITQAVLYVLCLLLIGGLFLLGSMICSVIYFIFPRKTGIKISRKITQQSFHAYLCICEYLGLLKLDLACIDVLNGQPPMVLVANHPSMIDVVLLGSRLTNYSCIAKQSLINHPILGMCARANAYVSNHNVQSMVRQSQKTLGAGGHVLLFPEGTRTYYSHNKGINQIGGGAALLAKRARVTIQVVFIKTKSNFLGHGWNMFSLPQFPIVYKLELGDKITSSNDLSCITLHMQKAYAGALT